MLSPRPHVVTHQVRPNRQIAGIDMPKEGRDAGLENVGMNISPSWGN